MPVPQHLEFFVDPSRCIGCQACVQACTECDTHKGEAMIHLEYVDRATSMQTVPVICMHCEQPTCAEVCPADAIKRTADGVVQSARKPRCIACGNCVVACPFGVPELYIERADHDEVRHVLRPHVGRQEADVRDGLPEPGALLRHPGADRWRSVRSRRRRTSSGSAPDHHHARQRDGAKAQSTPSHIDVTAAMEERPEPQSAGGRPARDRQFRPLRRSGGLAMADDPQSRFDQDRAIDPRIDSPGREGLTGTARGGIYEPRRDEPETSRSRPTVRRWHEQPQWRQDFPIDWPEDQFVARRDFAKFLVLTSGAFVAGQAWIAAQQPRPQQACAPRASRSERSRAIAAGSCDDVHLPDAERPCLLIRTRRRRAARVQPEVHAPLVRGGAQDRRGHPALSLPRGHTSTSRPAGTSPGLRLVRCP
jgi:Fe-S-cluster-containing hydrogenase component 2